MFRVDPSTLRRWRRRQHQTGSCHTLPRSGRPRHIGATDEAALRAQVAAHADATLAEHCQRWQEASGVAVSVPTMGRALRRLGLTLKKRP
jgi:transposase